MAIGIFPQVSEILPFENLSKEQTLILARETFKKNDWDVSFISETGMIGHTGMSGLNWGEVITVKWEYGKTSLQSESKGGQLIDWGKNRRNVDAFLFEFEKLKNEWKPEEQDSKWVELKRQFVAKEHDVLSQPPPTKKDEVKSFLSVFVPIEGYFITPILINLNIAIYIVMVVAGIDFFEPDPESMIKWGGNYRPMTMEGEWWRLLSSCFLHYGIFHLLMNLFALIYIGLALEPYLGKVRYTAAYLLTGIAASLLSLVWHNNMVSAGASGSIFGMYGLFLALLTTNFLNATVRKTFMSSIIIFVVYNLFGGLQEEVDNAAHIGGLLSGLLIGYAFLPGLRKPESPALHWAPIGAMVAVLGALTLATAHYVSNDIGIYNAAMERFSEQETQALKLYALSDSTTTEEQWMTELEKGIVLWKKNSALLEDLKKRDLPVDLRTRNEKLERYCELRIKTYELYYKGFKENTNAYEAEIAEYDEKVTVMLNDLTGKQD